MANKEKPLTVQKIRNFLRLMRRGKKQTVAPRSTMQVHRSPQQEWLKRGLVLAACALGQHAVGQQAVNPLLYEVNLRQHTPEGTIAAFQAQLDRMTALGVDMIWLMPVQPIGERKRKAKGDLFVEDIADTSLHKQYLGSPYSIRDYRAVNPDFGTLEEFRALVQACHARKIRVILDWVGNHTAWDHPWISTHPDWYTKNANGGITDPLNEQGQSMGWTDVADLDYSNRAMRKEMIAAMRFWLDSTGIDGFRCDVAMSVPADFWEEARQAFSDYKDLFMLAES
ncbi:MAG: alpha-amylase family glycosyl hydrolase, partial [Bacteroidia bacterium]